MAKELGYLPLALSQAVAYIVEREIDIATYLEICMDKNKQLELFNIPGFEKEDGYLKTVFYNVEYFLDALSKQSKDAFEILGFCGYLSPDVIPHFLLVDCLKKKVDEIIDIRALLKRFSLIEIDSSNTFRIHRLVQIIIRLQHNEKETNDRLTTLLCVMEKLYPSRDKMRDSFLLWPIFTVLLPHALMLRARAKEAGLTLITQPKLALKLGYFYYLRSDYIPALNLLNQARLEFILVHRTEEHADIALTLHELGSVLLVRGDLHDAKVLFEKSLAIYKKIHGTEEHLDFAATLQALGSMLYVQGDLTQAKPLFDKCLLIYKKIHGTEEHLAIAATLYSLGGILLDQGNLTQAKALFEKCLFIHKKIHGTEEHPDIVMTLHNLGGVLLDQGDLTQAKALFEKCLLIHKKIHGTEEHLAIAATLHQLGRVLEAQEDLKGAKNLFEKALMIKKKIHGTEGHSDNAATLYRLGGVLLKQGDLIQAKALFEKCLFIDKNIYNTEEHPDIGAILHELGRVLEAQGDLNGAKVLFEKSLSIQKKIYGTNPHPNSVITLRSLKRILKSECNRLQSQQTTKLIEEKKIETINLNKSKRKENVPSLLSFFFTTPSHLSKEVIGDTQNEYENAIKRLDSLM